MQKEPKQQNCLPQNPQASELVLNQVKKPSKQKNRSRSARQSIATKLQIKTAQQRFIMNKYFNQSNNKWSRNEIQRLSVSTGLTCDQVYKYLWNCKQKKQKIGKNKKSKSKIKEVNNSDQQAQPELHKEEELMPQLNRITVHQQILQFPDNLGFAECYYFQSINKSRHQQILQIIKEDGFKMICQLL